MGGGVAIYIHHSLPYTVVNLNSTLEVVACKVKFNNMHLVICSIYCPNNVRLNHDVLDSLEHQLPHSKIIVLGDFNAHHHLWGSQRSDGRGEQIANFISSSDLVLLNDGSATRVDDGTGEVSSIDLSLFSSTLANKFSWGTYDDSLGSDHFPILITQTCDVSRTSSTPKFNVKRADWGVFTRAVKLEPVGETIDDKIKSIQNSIIAAANTAIPKTSAVSDKQRVPWWTPDCRRAICERNRTYRLFNSHISSENFCKYKQARARARRVIKQAKRDSWHSFVSTINPSTPSTQVWSTVNRINRKYSRSPITSIHDNNQIIDDPRDIANSLAMRFSHTSSSANYHPSFLPIKEAAELTPIPFATEDIFYYNTDFTLEELQRALGACKGTSPGPDEIRYEMIQHLSSGDTAKLLGVYNELWRAQTFPNSWHFAHIIPIPKKGGDRKSTLSYRPIALTNCLCKVMERMVNRRLLFFLESQNLLNGHQCGFRKGRQTLDHLVNLENNIQQAFAKKEFLISVFLDIEKAYDMTWRNGLLRKLYALGLRGNLPIFIKNFMSDRTFSVKLQNNSTVMSDIFVQENGVPQGSVISPTLFIVMINDILPAPPWNLKYSLYADDCAIWHSSNNAQFSAGEVQKALDQIHHWGRQWGFKFSVTKSIGVIFTRRRQPNITLKLGNDPIPIKNSVRFLGLHFDSKLKWNVHIEQLLISSQKNLNLLKMISGNTWGADRKSLLMLYKSLIRSKIDYGSIVYDSAPPTTLRRLDVFQNKCLRVCLGALKCTRIERMEVESVVPPLRLRRNYLTLTYSFRVAREHGHPVHDSLHLDGESVQPLAMRLHTLCEKIGIDLSDVDTLVKEQIAPWQSPKFKVVTKWLPFAKATVPEEEARQRFREILNNHIDCFHLYTDGSKKDECVGAGVWSNECNLRFRLPNHTSIFIAELFAIDKAIDFAMSTTHDKIVIFSDSNSSLHAIKSLNTRTNEIQGNIIRKLVYSGPKSITLIWVPSHVGIHGNDMADELAQSTRNLDHCGVNRDPGCNVSLIKYKMHLLWQREWTSLSLNTIKPQIAHWSTASQRRRREEVTLARLRLNSTRLTHLTPFIERYFPPQCNTCNETLSIEHMICNCIDYNFQRLKLINHFHKTQTPFTLFNILSDDQKIVELLIIFLKETKLYDQL